MCAPIPWLGDTVESADGKVASISVALGQIRPQLGRLAGLSGELVSSSARIATGEKALKVSFPSHCHHTSA